MAIKQFIPTIWSETLYSQLDKHYIGVANCSRDYEGEIKEKGSRLKICGIGGVVIKDYTKDTDMSEAQVLSNNSQDLVIDQAKYFNFQIDDVDKAQSAPKLMEAAMKIAASGLANEADKFIYSMYNYAYNIVDVERVDENNIIEAIFKARRCLYEHNVTDAQEVVLEVSPAIAELILKAKANIGSDNTFTLEKGCLGSIAGCKIFVSNNIFVDTEESGEVNYHKCLLRTKRAITFAEQLSEINAYRPEKRFADAVKGLYLYGARVVYSAEMALLNFGIPKGN